MRFAFSSFHHALGDSCYSRPGLGSRLSLDPVWRSNDDSYSSQCRSWTNSHPIQNSFLAVWGGAPLSTNEGFAQPDASFPAGTIFTFNLINPVLYSNGGAAAPVSANTYVEIYDRFPGPTGGFVASPNTIDLHSTLASSVIIDTLGHQTPLAPFQVNGNTIISSAHELEATLFNPGLDGVYGYGFTYTAQLPSGSSVTVGPLVEVFETPGFTSASALVQQQAEIAVVTAVPEAVVAGVGPRRYDRFVPDIPAETP